MHATADAHRPQFAEVVRDACLSAGQQDARDQIARVLRGSASGSGRIETVEETCRLQFTDAIVAGTQAGRDPTPVGRGLNDGSRRRRPHVRQVLNQNRHTADTFFARLEQPVVVGIVIDVTGQSGGTAFGKVVSDAVFAAQKRNVGDHVRREHGAASSAVDGSGRRADTEQPGWLGLHDAILP